MYKLTLVLLLALLLSAAAWAQTTTYASPVKIMNTPVPVNGTVTVTPSGGAMPVSGTVTVTPSGATLPVSGSVSLTGTPTVKIDTNQNAVKLAAPRVFTGKAIGTLADGDTYFTLNLSDALGDVGYLVEVESLSGVCAGPSGNVLRSVYFDRVTPNGMEGNRSRLMIHTNATMSIGSEFYFYSPVKFYAKAPGYLILGITRHNAAGEMSCSATVEGRLY